MIILCADNFQPQTSLPSGQLSLQLCPLLLHLVSTRPSLPQTWSPTWPSLLTTVLWSFATSASLLSALPEKVFKYSFSALSSTQYPVPSIQYPVFSIQNPVPSTHWVLPSIQYPVPTSKLLGRAGSFCHFSSYLLNLTSSSSLSKQDFNLHFRCAVTLFCICHMCLTFGYYLVLESGHCLISPLQLFQRNLNFGFSLLQSSNCLLKPSNIIMWGCIAMLLISKLFECLYFLDFELLLAKFILVCDFEPLPALLPSCHLPPFSHLKVGR